MRHFFIAVLFSLVSVSALAAMTDSKTAKSDAQGYLGMSTGGLTLGAGYEYLYDGAQGLGGQLHYYQKDTTSKHHTNGFLILGGFTSYHFFKSTWDFALSPGMNIIQINKYIAGQSDETDLGPSLQVSLTQALNDRVAIGFDYANYWVWFGDSRGHVLNDLDVKVKVGF